MLNALLDGWFQYDVGEGAFMALFGFLFVICGIVILILLFTLLGLIMKKVNARKARKPKNAVPVPVMSAESEEGVTPELIAVLSAAVMAYYESENVKCDFVVKRIKKL